MSSLALRGVDKSFGPVHIIKNVDLEVPDGDFTVFVGPSGCGKSTLLRMIAGLEQATSGDILLDGKRVNEVAAAQRGLAMVFQSYALYPHMSVRQNLAFGLENSRTPRAEIEQRVDEAARHAGHPRAVAAQAAPALGRPAPARRDRPGDRPPPRHLPARRAALEPRRRAARRHARRAHPAAAPARRHHDLRHPRPGGGDDHGRPHRRAARRQGGAGRPAA